MVKILSLTIGIFSPLLLLFLLLSAVFFPLLAYSAAYIAIISVYILLQILLAVFSGTMFRRVLHATTALLILLLLLNVSGNKTEHITMGKGGHYEIALSQDTLDLTLVSLKIHGQTDRLAHSARLLINGDSLQLNNRRPARYDCIRFLELSHTRVRPFMIRYGDELLRIFPGQTDTLQQEALTFVSYDSELKVAGIRYHDIVFYHPVDKEISFLGEKLRIWEGDESFAAFIRYREIMPISVLLAAAALFMILINAILTLRKN
jgi:hypothetical protein